MTLALWGAKVNLQSLVGLLPSYSHRPRVDRELEVELRRRCSEKRELDVAAVGSDECREASKVALEIVEKACRSRRITQVRLGKLSSNA